MQLSRLLYIPCFIAVVILAVLIWRHDWIYLSIYAAIPVILMAVIYVLSPQIDWWWWKRYPLKMDNRLKALLSLYWPMLSELSPTDLRLFESRMMLYIKGRAFQFQGLPEGEDIKAMVAVHPVWLTLRQQSFLLEPYERIVLYKSSFPSPQFTQLHASELHEEDKVLLFSLQHIAASLKEPDQYFNTALYEFARVWVRCHPRLDYPTISAEHLPLLEVISGFPTALILQRYGYEDLDPLAVGIGYFVLFRERFTAVLPAEAEALGRLLP